MRSTPPQKQPASLCELKRLSKTFEAIQQSLVLALLNINGFGFKVRKPERRSQKPYNLYGDDSYESEISTFCTNFVTKELKESNYTTVNPSDIDSVSGITRVAVGGVLIDRLKQIKRHKDANRSALSFNLLLDRATKLGYTFKTRSTKPTKFTKKMSKICGVTGNIQFSLNEINEIGKQVNTLIFNRFNKEQTFVMVQPNDVEILHIYQNVTEKITNKTSIATEQTVVNEEMHPMATNKQYDIETLNEVRGETYIKNEEQIGEYDYEPFENKFTTQTHYYDRDYSFINSNQPESVNNNYQFYPNDFNLHFPEQPNTFHFYQQNYPYGNDTEFNSGFNDNNDCFINQSLIYRHN
ncbi:Uncharacterized protein QTN25_007513 [Entamoeba marina]